MEGFKISCIYYPTTIVIVDDNKSYLENVQYKIGKHILCKAYSDPEEALNYIQKAILQDNVLKDIVGIDTESGSYSHASAQLPLQYNVSKIYKHVYDKNRFEEISVVVVDYAMPSMNGEQFCRKLKELKGNPVKIIMLTGEADNPMAIKLFNSGIIDKFLRKAQEGLDEDLKNSIIDMQKNYFRDTNYPITKALSSDEDSSLGDPAFIEFFNQTCRDISATSYYLIELSGSFIFFNDAGSPTWLIIKTLNELKEIAQQVEFDISPELAESVMNGEVVPYFGGSEYDYYSDESNFKRCLHKAKKLSGKTVYCYALLNELPEFSLDKENIISFKEHISNL